MCRSASAIAMGRVSTRVPPTASPAPTLPSISIGRGGGQRRPPFRPRGGSRPASPHGRAGFATSGRLGLWGVGSPGHPSRAPPSRDSKVV